MPGLFSWYNQYGPWNRMRRIQAPQTVARVDSRTSRVATAIHNGADDVDVNPADGNANANHVVINMGDLSLNSPPLSPTAKDNKDTLFGPSIGVVSTAPEWCAVDAALDEKLFKSEKKFELNEKLDDDNSEDDELTPEIVKEWVRRSKEPSEPTTTLQALVNLKRPSIRLSPLAAPSSDPSTSLSPDEPADSHGKHHQQHGLEFEFDCDAPQCFISLHAFGVPASLGEPEEQRQAAHLHLSTRDAGKENERLVLFETTLPGGFAKKLTLGDGAVLELARLEAAAKAHRAQLAASAAAAAASASTANLSTNGGSGTSTPGGPGNGERHEHIKRLTTFFRKRGNVHISSHNPFQTATPPPAVATGPALAVVDAEAADLHPNANVPGGTISAQNQNTLATFFAGGDAEKARRKKESEEQGVRVAIRITARDADGRPMKVRNEQVTYLHIVKQGPSAHPTTSGAPANGDSDSTAEPSSSTSANANSEPATGEQERKEEDKDKEEDDIRPWVVRVVKREARIGAHAFQLHEIYGLTAHASASDNTNAEHHVTPSSPTSSPEQQHTYPPTPGQPQPAAETDDSPAECLLCLSAAREVVLLPCRHLVACRECAVNMVEFGAGGTVVQPVANAANETEAPSGGANAGENAGTEGTAGQGAQAAGITQTPTPATRRKRKAKGWFCPVCRQPYTSLLRITTAPPPTKGLGLGGADGTNTGTGGDAKRVSLTSSVDANEVNEASPAQTQQHSHPLATVLEGGTVNSTTLSRVGVNANHNVSSDDITNAYNPNSISEGGNAGAAGAGAAMESRGGGLVSFRPGFLRRISGRAANAAPAGGRDLERGA